MEVAKQARWGRRTGSLGVALALLVAAAGLTGCSIKLLSPTTVHRYDADPASQDCNLNETEPGTSCEADDAETAEIEAEAEQFVEDMCELDEAAEAAETAQ
jgi:hypothetical protein